MWYIPTCSNIYLLYNSGFKLNTFVFDAADDECALAGDVIWFSVSSSTADIEIPLVQWSGLLSQVICTEGMENSNQTQSRERHKLNWANVNECETREASFCVELSVCPWVKNSVAGPDNAFQFYKTLPAIPFHSYLLLVPRGNRPSSKEIACVLWTL